MYFKVFGIFHHYGLIAITQVYTKSTTRALISTNVERLEFSDYNDIVIYIAHTKRTNNHMTSRKALNLRHQMFPRALSNCIPATLRDKSSI